MTTEATGGTPRSAEEWRAAMVEALSEPGALGGQSLSPEVERALRTVARHVFVPEADLEQAYDPFTAVVTKYDQHGAAISSVSAPQVQAMMLQQAQLQPGHRVLEIGSGGYNAALIAELVGPSGEVTTLDIDSGVTERASRLLKDTGYGQVRVVTADAAHGLAEHAPFDAIIVTAGAWDLPRAWVEQLVEGGRLVVPLRMRNLSRSIGFVRAGEYLTSTSVLMCGFVPMQGEDEHRETLVLVNGTGEIALRFDDEVPEDPHLLDNAVRTPRAEVWSGATVVLQELIGTLQLYLATTLPGFCTMAVDPDLDTGLVAPDNPRFSMAAVQGADFAYLVTRRTPDNTSVEYGVHAFGPTAPEFAEQVAQRIREWATDQRHGPGPHIDAYPASTPLEELPGELVITKRHSRLTFSWPEATKGTSGQAPPLEHEGE